MTKNDYPNWFSMGAEFYFKKHFLDLPNNCYNFLQIGAYTGDASLWLCENLLTHPDSRLYDVDTWLGSDEEAHHSMDFSDVERVYDEKLLDHLASKKIIKKKMTSKEFLKQNTVEFDFIYIDGGHEAPNVLEDFIFAFDNVKQNGIIAFDDYTWGEYLPIHKRPAFAIDAIRNCYIEKVEVIDTGSQIWMKKL